MHPAQNPNHRGEDTRVLCHHTFPSTADDQPRRHCGSPALRGEAFCFYHHPTRNPAKDPQARREKRLARRRLEFPLPTNRAEVQHALLYLTHLIATSQIDTRRAGLLLLALQTTTKTLEG